MPEEHIDGGFGHLGVGQGTADRVPQAVKVRVALEAEGCAMGAKAVAEVPAGLALPSGSRSPWNWHWRGLGEEGSSAGGLPMRPLARFFFVTRTGLAPSRQCPEQVGALSSIRPTRPLLSLIHRSSKYALYVA